jgi:hypothetical protein
MVRTGSGSDDPLPFMNVRCREGACVKTQSKLIVANYSYNLDSLYRGMLGQMSVERHEIAPASGPLAFSHTLERNTGRSLHSGKRHYVTFSVCRWNFAAGRVWTLESIRGCGQPFDDRGERLLLAELSLAASK